MSVPGIGPVLIDDIRDKFVIEEEIVEVEIPGDDYDGLLLKAREAMKAEQMDEALAHYDTLIKSRQYISDVIDDLNGHLSTSPLDIQTWVSLGDAFLHIDRLESALEAYNKAEELLR